MRFISFFWIVSSELLCFCGSAAADTIQFIISFDENCNAQTLFGEKDSTPFKCGGSPITYTYGKSFSQVVQPGYVQINDKGTLPGQLVPSDLIDFPDAGLDQKGNPLGAKSLIFYSDNDDKDNPPDKADTGLPTVFPVGAQYCNEVPLGKLTAKDGSLIKDLTGSTGCIYSAGVLRDSNGNPIFHILPSGRVVYSYMPGAIVGDPTKIYEYVFISDADTASPEPATWLLLGSGVAIVILSKTRLLRRNRLVPASRPRIAPRT
jgi:hypothetical protein